MINSEQLSEAELTLCKKLRTGANGTVFLAYYGPTKENVAVKAIPINNNTKERFVLEASAATLFSFAAHQSIISTIECFNDDS